MESQPGDMIPGLPDDLALNCLVRISHGYHGLLKCVSKKWEAAIKSDDYLCRKEKEGLCGNWLIALSPSDHTLNCVAYDPDADHWHPIPPVPTTQRRLSYGHSCVSACKRCFIIGGAYRKSTFGLPVPSSEVLMFDPFKMNWSRVSSMTRGRNCFACAAVLDKIYVAGGSEISQETGEGLASASAEVYDPLENRWDELPPMPVPLIGCFGVSHSGQFHVLGRKGPDDGEVDTYFRFNPADHCWHSGNDFEELPTSSHLYPSATHGVYAVDDKRAIQYPENALRNWQTIGVIPDVAHPNHDQLLTPFNYAFVSYKKYLFLMGGSLLKFDGRYRCSFIPKLRIVRFCDTTQLPLEWRDARPLPPAYAGPTECFTLEE
ncbi:F-box domain-containing protein [Dioscorea alata]|uniref:F-box domain-containing protein n=1 Tax=Dioscorea alata TaxID=55571 RepID=A0ACB7VP84_DIOAL|nr:F-box domain-containing protein [Dioscorea alata]